MNATKYQPDPLLTELAAAKFLNVSTRTLQSWRTKDQGPAYIKVGRAVRYRCDDLLMYVDANTVRVRRTAEDAGI